MQSAKIAVLSLMHEVGIMPVHTIVYIASLSFYTVLGW